MIFTHFLITRMLAHDLNPDDNLSCFHVIYHEIDICVIWVKILNGIEY